jgi:hypothetical protein
MQQKAFRCGPIALTNAAANLLNPGTTTGGVNCTASPYGNLRLILTHIVIVNKTGSAATVTLYIGATGGSAAGTEFLYNGTTVPANSYVERYCRVPLDVADFLTGLASANTTLTFEAEGEIGVA